MNLIDGNLLKPVLRAIRLETNGDRCEMDAAKTYNFTNNFPEYERFWQLHVLPATMRPDGIGFRPKASDFVRTLGEFSYSIFDDMYSAEQAFERIENDDFGRKNNKNVKDFITSSGNAIQKIKNLQDAIKSLFGGLEGIEYSSSGIFPNKSHEKTWLKQRRRIIAYRNAITHQMGTMAFFYDNSDASFINPFMLNPIIVENYFYEDRQKQNFRLTWKEIGTLFENDRTKFVLVKDGCKTLRITIYCFLNNTYKLINNQMDSLFLRPDYQDQWGMDLMAYDKLINNLYPTIPKEITTASSVDWGGSGPQGPQQRPLDSAKFRPV